LEILTPVSNITKNSVTIPQKVSLKKAKFNLLKGYVYVDE